LTFHFEQSWQGVFHVAVYRGGALGFEGGFPRIGVLGTFVHAVNGAIVREALGRLVAARAGSQIVTVNVDFLAVSRGHDTFQSIINGADLTVMDGKPLVWAARYMGIKECERITGPDLMEAAAELSVREGARIFLLGGSQGAAEGTREVLESKYPGVNICGAFEPRQSSYPFPADLDAEICQRIEAARPDILFVGFGAPKQELWIHDHLKNLDVPVAVGIGGSFNFFSGSVARAPEFLQRLGLEWSYRLWKEPSRLWRRYVLQDIPFVLRVLAIEVLSRVRVARNPALKVESAYEG
jgi:N-acetylglucosaminyldiphosphoundecaprenol N-acetyl-beta-D-mannosaminyltransferase